MFTLIVLGKGIAPTVEGASGAACGGGGSRRPPRVLGAAVEYVNGRLPTGARWLMCGSFALFLAVGPLAGVLSGRGTRWTALVGVPMVAVPLLLGGFAGHGPPAGRPGVGAVPDVPLAVAVRAVGRRLSGGKAPGRHLTRRPTAPHAAVASHPRPTC
ncbi:hypothetical protein ACIGQE_18785 [Streptomyces sp. NPDC053429]|uniref:hypothetical protein n=1 Tax=Streptomyces sp. NPDC053429 TaxID=3365702 RepID=UPI0037D3E501